MKVYTLPIAKRGLQTEFTEADEPLVFASELENRFINLNGDAEAIPGLKAFRSPYEDSATVINVTDTNFKAKIHEHVKKNGDSVLIASIVKYQYNTTAAGQFTYVYVAFYYYDTVQSRWKDLECYWSERLQNSGFLSETNIVSFFVPAGSPFNAKYQVFSRQMGTKTIFACGHIETSYYDEETNKIYPLQSIIEQGVATSGTNTTTLKDSDISNWLTQTNVRVNDLIFNTTKGGYGVITSVGTNNLDHTIIADSANIGIGSTLTTVLGGSGGNQASGDRYQIIDLIENNWIPVTGQVSLTDNVLVAGTLTDSGSVYFDNTNFNGINDIYRYGLRPGDYVYNATRNSVNRIQAIRDINNASVRYQLSFEEIDQGEGVSGQAAGDTLIFLKSAVPNSTYPHVHYGRLYLISERDQTRVFPSAPDDPEDFTTFQETLNSNSVNYATQQGQGERILTLDTFQRYLVAGGERNVYLSEGTSPIQDSSASTTDFQPVGLFTQGVFGQESLASIGDQMLFASRDGLRSFNVTSILAVTTDNISEVIKSELVAAINVQAALDPSLIKIMHYPKRNWVMFKIGRVIYNFNYTKTFIEGELVVGGTWSKITSKLAKCKDFLMRRNGTLMAVLSTASTSVAGVSQLQERSRIYEFDTGKLDDDGEDIPTVYESAWVGPGDGIVQDTRYIKPYFQTKVNKTYNISITSDIGTERLDDTATYTASATATTYPVVGQAIVGQLVVGGQSVARTQKLGLRSRNQHAKIRITTTSGQSGDIISKFMVYGSNFGIK
jgi:hypothetical protein